MSIFITLVMCFSILLIGEAWVRVATAKQIRDIKAENKKEMEASEARWKEFNERFGYDK